VVPVIWIDDRFGDVTGSPMGIYRITIAMFNNEKKGSGFSDTEDARM